MAKLIGCYQSGAQIYFILFVLKIVMIYLFLMDHKLHQDFSQLNNENGFY
jgi:hypothetical protein